ncbi:1,4-alpha-glucan branching protein GlgB [Tuwongella immobilis]|uniref:1,4-alpha-glucan branching enzyme GlgB n=1 Tax=Tuwongella immobilis TaxID=692036 RepID=A0A6C2YUL4_9BACT|nr:1,4-alpha-glucan branching protein GlgB [Tuwongella immobilis]VIP05047.1 glycogen branching protein : 1,4-alpha-glucan branching enzyme GlgB OS=Nitrolancea hollandica Lb GN=glgB PE=3 SV=1: CBM_48: Alpha-amylase: Alpha-amylase: Alpha-amylase_C [Tuwongella immobilis]VTS07450.1 glycogen branching protein : 1,4-alpha-glucan branching enzyme GlgB OS=Nitrolancea hollandica Lb GN=glgB PE=3 SV=1: CBM_48: Alpha-amylase: Alpha-amylase: Alpha-amylase_C [Tuwongella immobilis]
MNASTPIRYDCSLITSDDRYLFNEGNHFHLYEKLGAHPGIVDGVAGTFFGVWAPNAESVTVMGDFNGWNRDSHPLTWREHSGIWEAFLPGIGVGEHYKYFVRSRYHGFTAEKSDPFAFRTEVPPKTASVVTDLHYDWNDAEWMKTRGERHRAESPISIYELHLGSWRRAPGDYNRPLDYRETAKWLIEHVKRCGFTHVEFLPLMEHPFYGSWGYQTTGYFAPTARYGAPQDLKYLIDQLHQHGIGVILDWVPSHFPCDGHGLAYFDGTHLFEHSNPKEGFHPDWQSAIFNYGRNEVRSFLISSAMFWMNEYHVDGLRVDAVASMLYRDYSRKEGEWIPNVYGGRENLEAIHFLRRLNEAIYAAHPDATMIAEESTAWGGVSRPTYTGGLGFGAKWDMGWMHDTLKYFAQDPVHRKYHHSQLTFRMIYAFSENFVLSLSHDEVVHGKGSLLNKMPGDPWQKFANLRLLYAYMTAMPGKKLLFMGSEFAQWEEWKHESSLDWHLTESGPHAGMMQLVGDLNRLYVNESTLHEWDWKPEGFRYVEANDGDNSVLAFLRFGSWGKPIILCVFNFTPVPRPSYRVGVPCAGYWSEVVNTDATIYGGTGSGNLGGVSSAPIPSQSYGDSIQVNVPPLACVMFKWEA